LSQIIINLVTNAIKAIVIGGRVSIIATREKDIVRIEVADNGGGISEEDIPHLFERFYKGAGDGLGLGLAIVKELTAAHGGSVKVKSIINKGATFSLNFPNG
jgi:two-component system sensor histidine kinase BaeS